MSVLLFLSTASLGYLAFKLYQEKVRLSQSLERYKNISSREEVEHSLDQKIDSQNRHLQELQYYLEGLSAEIAQKKKQLNEVNTELNLQSLGFYEPQYDFLMLEDYKNRFDAIKNERKLLISNGRAAISWTPWVVGDDARKGKKMVKDYLRLIRDAFDVVCDSAINEVKTKSRYKLKKRIISNFERLNKLSQTLKCEISEEYRDLRTHELDLKYEMEKKKQEEREKEKIRREKLRQEKKERQKLEEVHRKQIEAEEKEAKLRREEEELVKKIDSIASRNRAEDKAELARLREENEYQKNLIKDAQRDVEKARENYRKIKSGVVFVVSSEKSFGSDIYRVFMTKSGEPRQYIKKMNPYIPFQSLVHIEAEFEDASDAIEKIHGHLWEKRVNRNNPRRDFFKTSLGEIRQIIHDVSRVSEAIYIIEYEDDMFDE